VRSSRRRTDFRKTPSRRTASPIRSDLIYDKDSGRDLPQELRGASAIDAGLDKAARHMTALTRECVEDPAARRVDKCPVSDPRIECHEFAVRAPWAEERNIGAPVADLRVRGTVVGVKGRNRKQIFGQGSQSQGPARCQPIYQVFHCRQRAPSNSAAAGSTGTAARAPKNILSLLMARTLPQPPVVRQMAGKRATVSQEARGDL
jgi:hypothetical protein